MFEKYLNENKLPIMDNQTFDRITHEIGRDKFRTELAEYIARVRPPFPLKKITEKDMILSFQSLVKQDIWKYLNPKEQVIKEIFEKYNDYKYPFSKYGLGLINAPSTFNSVSDYYHNHLRLDCSSYSFKSPIDVWNNGTAKEIWSCLGPIWRGINNVKLKKDADGNERYVGGVLNEKSYISAFRLQTYIATQFKPNVAKAVYEITNAKKVLDTSCGWGDRLAGFYTSSAKEYIGCDPNPNTFAQYMKQVYNYERLLGNRTPIIKEEEDYFTINASKKVTIYRKGAEDLPWDEIKDIDCAFTSPPYFATEKYNEGGESVEDQSWHKFSEYESWRDDFFLPVSINSFKSLSETGHMFINIMDPTVKGKRYRSCDELVDKLEDNFVGQIGMRIMQRPQGRVKFKTKEELNEFMNKLYIENIWCFSKTSEDYFKHSRIETLEKWLV
tara:strand:+ start:328 stop:1653 length:1326 start_codon:yes stop_codon:yes gene_type:complete